MTRDFEFAGKTAGVCVLKKLRMRDKPTEKIKPFKLVKYFTSTSIILMFLGALIISAVNTYWIRTLLLKKSEDYALLLIENLNHQIFLQFVIPVALRYGKIQLRQQEQFERMDKVVRSTLHSFQVDMVTIHDLNNIVSYSFDPDMIGRQITGGTEYQNARNGLPSSTHMQRGNFFQLLLGLPQESRLITFAPLRAEQPLSVISGPVLGVVEIVQDLSSEHKEIAQLQILIVETCSVVMLLLFLILRYTVKRGEEIIQKRNEEQMALKEELSRARHLSSLGEMTAGISHEIRNPLGIIKSSAELLKKKLAQTNPENAIPGIIVEESERLDKIITDFLDFAKPITPHFSRCNLMHILEKNITHLEPELHNTKCRITHTHGSNIPDISGDKDMLYQAFLNILINAIQAMPEGGAITITTRPMNNAIQITLDDEGEGVRQDVLDKIWDPFFTAKEKGTGLGLGIVKKIIEAHHGTIDAANRDGGGFRIIIELPVTQEM